MNMNKCKMISILLSAAVIVFSIVAIIVFLVTDYFAYYKAGVFWEFLFVILLISHVAVTFVAKSTFATTMMIAALPAYLLILPMTYSYKYFVILLFGSVFLLNKKIAIKISGPVVCIIMMISLVIISGIPDDNSWNPDIQTISEQSLVTDNGSKEAEVTVYRMTKTYYQEEGYALGIYFRELGVIDLGPIGFARGYKGSTISKKYSQYPDMDVKWIDNNTFYVNGDTFVVE